MSATIDNIRSEFSYSMKFPDCHPTSHVTIGNNTAYVSWENCVNCINKIRSYSWVRVKRGNGIASLFLLRLLMSAHPNITHACMTGMTLVLITVFILRLFLHQRIISVQNANIYNIT